MGAASSESSCHDRFVYGIGSTICLIAFSVFSFFFSPIVGGEMKERSLQVIRDQAVKSHILDGLFCNSIIVRNGFLGLI